MSLRVRFRFDGRCSVHPRYNPEKDGRPQHKDCSGCESLWVIHVYTLCGAQHKVYYVALILMWSWEPKRAQPRGRRVLYAT